MARANTITTTTTTLNVVYAQANTIYCVKKVKKRVLLVVCSNDQ